MRGPACFIDASGGAFAAIAAALARAAGRREVIAATRSAKVSIPHEIAVVLDEVGAVLPEVVVLDGATAKGATEVIDVAPWELSLFDGEGELERLAAARIARDRIERRVEAMVD